MNTQTMNPVVVLTEEDYILLKPYVDKLPDRDEEMSLAHELKRAVIVKKHAFPKHGIRLNSRVTVLDLDTQKEREFTIVMPGQADIRQNKISVLTPMSAALIGLRKGEEVKWKVPAGIKYFRIVDVVNS